MTKIAKTIASIRRWPEPRTLLISSLLLAPVGTGCSAEVGIGETEDVAQTEQRIENVGVEFRWRQGEAELNTLIPAAGHACFLTMVQGRFRGGGEWIRLRTLNGTWRLGGASQQAGVEGRARCVALGFATLDPPVSITGIGDRALGVFHPRAGKPVGDTGVCYLTRVQGNFQGLGENIRVERVATHQYFARISGAQAGLAGTFQCIRNQPAVWPDNGTSGYVAYANESVPTQMTHRFTTACALTRMQGGFHGGGESLLISHNTVNDVWQLGAQKVSGQGVNASAWCF